MAAIKPWLAANAVALIPAVALFALFVLSEILGATKAVRANGVVQLLIHVVGRLFARSLGVAQVEDAFARAPVEDVSKRQVVDRSKLLGLLPLLFLAALLGGATGCSPAQWQTYLARGGVCELQAAAAALGSGANGLLQDIEAAVGGQPAFAPDAWAARAISGLGAAAIAEAQCRAAHLLADLATPAPRTAALLMWRAPCHSVQAVHRPYLEALLRVRR